VFHIDMLNTAKMPPISNMRLFCRIPLFV